MVEIQTGRYGAITRDDGRVFYGTAVQQGENIRVVTGKRGHPAIIPLHRIVEQVVVRSE